MSAQVVQNSTSTVQLNSQYGTEADYQNAVKDLVAALPPGSTSTDESVLEAHGKSFGDKKARKRALSVQSCFIF